MACCSASPPLTTCMQHGFCSCSLPPPHANYLVPQSGNPHPEGNRQQSEQWTLCVWHPTAGRLFLDPNKSSRAPWACHGSKVGNALGLELLHTAGSEMVHARVDRMPEAARRSPCGDAPRAAIGFAQSRQPRHRQSGAAPAHSSAVSGRCFFSFKSMLLQPCQSAQSPCTYGLRHCSRSAARRLGHYTRWREVGATKRMLLQRRTLQSAWAAGRGRQAHAQSSHEAGGLRCPAAPSFNSKHTTRRHRRAVLSSGYRFIGICAWRHLRPQTLVAAFGHHLLGLRSPRAPPRR